MYPRLTSTVMLVTIAFAGPAAALRPLEDSDFRSCNDRAMQAAGIQPSGVIARDAREKQEEPGPKDTTVQPGPAPESRLPAASPETEKLVPRESRSTRSAVPEAELSRVVQAYEDCLRQRLGLGDRGRHEEEGQTGQRQRPPSGEDGARGRKK